jgi:hypothetical protein
MFASHTSPNKTLPSTRALLFSISLDPLGAPSLFFLSPTDDFLMLLDDKGRPARTSERV